MSDAETMTTLDVLDADLRAASADRSQAWRELVIKDTPARRSAYEAACAQVDGLLEMRHAEMLAETPLVG